MKTKGCESSEDLKALNESGFKTVSDLKKAVEKSLNIFDINIASTGMKTDVIKDNIKNIMENATVKELSNYKLSASVRWGIWGKYSNIKPIFAILGC